jgi:DNA helicase HerA-like ATPase
MIEPLLIAQTGTGNERRMLELLPAMANRHGLIAGATGTGKTVTLQTLAERLSSIGVPVFMADVKGDLSGIGAAGQPGAKFKARLEMLGIAEDFTPRACPVAFWDVYGESGHPVRATISDMGPLLLSRLLNLNETQSGVLQLVFRIADDGGLLLLDMKDLRAMVQHVGEHAKDYTTEYGNISTASIGAIQRGLLTLEEQGADKFFGEPMLDIADLMQTDGEGRGVVNILAAEKLYQSPRVYGTFLLWLLSELFEQLPEAGDLDKPKLVFFFDEAHLLFADASPVLLQKIEQVVRLIRSKGVGVWFVTQNPLDVPDTVLGQLGNRVQHALRAFTPRDQKAVRTAAETLRANPAFDPAAAITELGVGEALLSFLDAQGRPGMVERCLVLPPASRIGPLSADERRAIIRSSVVYGHYEQVEDRESAYERLKGTASANTAAPTTATRPSGPVPDARNGWGSAGVSRPAPEPVPQPAPAEGGGFFGGLGDMLGGGNRRGDTVVQAALKSAARSVGSQVGRAIIRGVLGSILGGRR